MKVKHYLYVFVLLLLCACKANAPSATITQVNTATPPSTAIPPTPTPTITHTPTQTPTPTPKSETNIVIDGQCDEWPEDYSMEMQKTGMIGAKNINVFAVENNDSLYVCVSGLKGFEELTLTLDNENSSSTKLAWPSQNGLFIQVDTTSSEVGTQIGAEFINSKLAYQDGILEFRIFINDFTQRDTIFSGISIDQMEIVVGEVTSGIESRVYFYSKQDKVKFVNQNDPLESSDDSANAVLKPTLLPFDLASGCIQMAVEGYELRKILDTPYGLPAQTSLLPGGELVISEYGANTISIIGGNNVQKLVSGTNELAQVVATLPDGKIAFSPDYNGVSIIDPDSGNVTQLGFYQTVGALASDEEGNIFVVTFSGNVFKIVPATNKSSIIARNLPFEFARISDLDIADDGTIYVAGFTQVIAISEGEYFVVAPNLNYEPVWVEIAPGGMVYINDMANGLHRYNPNTKQLIKLNNIPAFGDIVAPSDNEIIFYNWRGSFYKHDFSTGKNEPFFIHYGNSHAFAVDENGSAYFMSANMHDVHNTNLMSVSTVGELNVFENFSYKYVPSADFDFDQNLCLATDQGFHCYQNGELVKEIVSSNNSERFRNIKIAMGPNGDWYFIVTNQPSNIMVYKMDSTGYVTTMPFSFSLSSFGGAYKVSGSSIDVGSNGKLAMIITADGTRNDGPYLQRIFRADSDGSNLTEIANLDSDRIAGMVDIAVAPNNDIFVLNVQGGNEFYADPIYRIDEENVVHEFVHICGGHDPKSIDVDANGNLWFSTTTGIFQVMPVDN